ncbi:hypothetical protein CIB84_004059, partial [Bambusicola thoracicus]
MITALSREYGFPLADEDLFTQKPPLLSFSSDYTPPGNVSREKKAQYSSLDDYNERYVLSKKEIDKKSFERNHIRANIDAVCQLKGKMKRLRFETFRISPADGKSVYNYISQSLNSAKLAKKHLRQEMAKKWQENALYANMEPVLSRGRWSWDKRHVDFELYKKPPELHVATASLTAAELRKCGPGATSELQKLQGLLKDEPLKFSLGKPGLILKPIPALSVLGSQNSSDVLPGKKSVCSGFVPGLQDHHSLKKWNKNVIPCHNREQKKFEKLKGADF